MAALVEEAGAVISGSLAPKSREIYNKTYQHYKSFAQSLGYAGILPGNPGLLILYLSHLFKNGLASSTLLSKVSALSYSFKLHGHQDPSQHFLVQKFLKGAKSLRPSADVRQPITVNLLKSCNQCLNSHMYSVYKRLLFKCMINLAFFAFLRPGEITDSIHNLQFNQVIISEQQLSVTFVSFKHYHGVPVTLLIKAQHGSICPVNSVKQFVKVRGTGPGPFFADPLGLPVKYSEFLNLFKDFNIALNNVHLSPHSLRIGAATFATMSGYSQDQVKRMGRWHSDAVLKYVRIPSFQVQF